MAEEIPLYEGLEDFDIGQEIKKLRERNQELQNHITGLDEDVEKLCKCITDMKKVQENLANNISELFKTAKAEIDRKDRMIAELREQLDGLIFRRNVYQPAIVENRNPNKDEVVEVKPKEREDDYSRTRKYKSRECRERNHRRDDGYKRKHDYERDYDRKHKHRSDSRRDLRETLKDRQRSSDSRSRSKSHPKIHEEEVYKKTRDCPRVNNSEKLGAGTAPIIVIDCEEILSDEEKTVNTKESLIASIIASEEKNITGKKRETLMNNGAKTLKDKNIENNSARNTISRNTEASEENGVKNKQEPLKNNALNCLKDEKIRNTKSKKDNPATNTVTTKDKNEESSIKNKKEEPLVNKVVNTLKDKTSSSKKENSDAINNVKSLTWEKVSSCSEKENSRNDNKLTLISDDKINNINKTEESAKINKVNTLSDEKMITTSEKPNFSKDNKLDDKISNTNKKDDPVKNNKILANDKHTNSEKEDSTKTKKIYKEKLSKNVDKDTKKSKSKHSKDKLKEKVHLLFDEQEPEPNSKGDKSKLPKLESTEPLPEKSKENTQKHIEKKSSPPNFPPKDKPLVESSNKETEPVSMDIKTKTPNQESTTHPVEKSQIETQTCLSKDKSPIELLEQKSIEPLAKKPRLEPSPPKPAVELKSFENILSKNQEITSAKMQVNISPTEDIPVLHLDENLFTASTNLDNTQNQSIMKLLDVMNISTLEPIPLTENNPQDNLLTFTNCLSKITSTPKTVQSLDSLGSQNSSKNSSNEGGTLLSSNRKRRRCIMSFKD